MPEVKKTDSDRIADLEKQVRLLTQKLDETRRFLGQSPILDAQILAINVRSPLSGGNAA